jgi:hypothetical protein
MLKNPFLLFIIINVLSSNKSREEKRREEKRRNIPIYPMRWKIQPQDALDEAMKKPLIFFR